MVIRVATLPDLQQYTLSLLTTEVEGMPLFMQVGSGNELDQKAFVSMIKEFKSQWTGAAPEVYIADCSSYFTLDSSLDGSPAQ